MNIFQLTSEQEIERGQQAKRLIEDSMFQEGVQQLATGLVDMWQSETNTAKREELWRQQHSLTNLVDNLTTVMANGEFVAKKLKVK